MMLCIREDLYSWCSQWENKYIQKLLTLYKSIPKVDHSEECCFRLRLLNFKNGGGYKFSLLWVAVDTVFCPPSICVPDHGKSKNIIFFLHGAVRTSRMTWHNPFGHQCTWVPFLAKMTKMPLVSPRFDQRSNKVKTLTKQYFS